MLKNTLIKAVPAIAESARPKLTVINSSAPAANPVSLATIIDKFAEIGVKDILVINGKGADVHKIKSSL